MQQIQQPIRQTPVQRPDQIVTRPPAVQPRPQPSKPCNCDPMAIAGIQSRLTSIETTLAGMQSPAPSHASHLVLVADTAADYWPRLRDEFAAAKGYYSAMRLAPPPTFSVPLPQLVLYRDGTPVQQYVGPRKVSEQLVAISRGEFAAE